MGEVVTQSSLVMASVLFTVLMAGAVAALVPLWRVAGLALASVRQLLLRLRAPALPTVLSQHLSPAGEFILCEQPPRGDLGAARLALADQLRVLLRSTEPTLGDPALHAGVRRNALGYGDASDAGPSLGLSGELWRWLQSAETILAKEEHVDELLETVARALREQLLADGPFLPRLARMLDLLVRYDTAVRQPLSGGYRSSGSDRLGPALSPLCPRGAYGSEDEPVSPTPDEVLARHDREIRSVAGRYADDRAARQDLGQEIRLAVWRALPAYRGEGSLRSYVLRIAHLCGAGFARRQWRHLELTASAGPRDPSLHADPELELRRRMVSDAVDELPPSQREPLVLQLAGHSYREIGDTLGLSETNVSARISRARARLKQSLADD